MKTFGKAPFLFALAWRFVDGGVGNRDEVTAGKCYTPDQMRCAKTDSPPSIDADLSEWTSVKGIETGIYKLGGTRAYTSTVSYKCLYDDSNIYMALEIPGDYRFDTEDNHLCPAIGTMFKVGEKATYLGMGGCPDARTSSCTDGVPEACNDYLVDLGAHWELRTTEQGVAYPMSTGSGNDLVANKDDEYGVSPSCRFDDDDTDAGNEWTGAWAHTADDTVMEGEEGATGVYTFELSRTLVTQSSYSDVQLAEGETYKFGIAYWDPFEVEDSGWTDAGHYLTGCASEWIDLELRQGTSSVSSDTTPTTSGATGSATPEATESVEENTGANAGSGSMDRRSLLAPFGLLVVVASIVV